MKKLADHVFDFFNLLILTLFALSCIFPFYYLFINTISDNELTRIGAIRFLPRGVHLDNYKALVNVNNLANAVAVSVGRTVIGTVLMVAASAFAGYLVTQQKMWKRSLWYRLIVVTMYFNAGLIPLYLNMSLLGLTNNFLVYIVPLIVQPFNIILVKTYIESIPRDLEESAFMDGAGYVRVFVSIIAPIAKPIIATIAVFGAVAHWNSFIDTMIFVPDNPRLYSLQYQLYIYLRTTSNLKALMDSGGRLSETQIQAVLNLRTVKFTVAMITVLPILLVYPFLQRYFQKGIMIGAVKG
ncbi:MAG: carbohydrate ABC transporter permease [Spirochaetota bacterium]